MLTPAVQLLAAAGRLAQASWLRCPDEQFQLLVRFRRPIGNVPELELNTTGTRKHNLFHVRQPLKEKAEAQPVAGLLGSGFQLQARQTQKRRFLFRSKRS